MNPKKIAGDYAATLVHAGMVVGLGTGSTADWAIRSIAARCRDGLKNITAVSTSDASTNLAASLGIAVVGLESAPIVDLTIDGADEVDASLNLIKGLGGALLREKIVAASSKRLVIIIDASKRVEQLGTLAPLPVEVVPFAWPVVQRQLRNLELRTALRQPPDSVEPYTTDNGNYIIDCHFPHGITDAQATENLINRIPGIVENGLFVGLADQIIVGRDDGKCDILENPMIPIKEDPA